MPHTEPAARLFAAHTVMRQKSRTAALAEAGEVGGAYDLALGVVASACVRIDNRYGEYKENSSRRGAIIAAYIVGLSLVEVAILEGYGTQAAALVRQELEAIAALEELHQGKRTEAKTPNIANVGTVPGSVYGDLSKLAHFSSTSALRSWITHDRPSENAPGPAEAFLVSPQHQPESTTRLFALHTLLLLHLAQHQAIHYEDLYGVQSTAEELANAGESLAALLRSGMVQNAA
jgi:hypothetical protein